MQLLELSAMGGPEQAGRGAGGSDSPPAVCVPAVGSGGVQGE